jgi:uncharacterized membrane protein
MPSYSALLFFHICAVAVFLAGLVVETASIPSLSRVQPLPAERRDELRRLRQLNRVVATPALALVWALGLTMAWEAGWYVAAWLQAKIGLVLLLSAIHGIATARLRKLDRGVPIAPATLLPMTAALLLALAIGVLVIAKP